MSYALRIAAPIAALAFALAQAQTARADLITDWNLIAVNEIKAQGGALAGPNPATRTLAITHAAIYDVVANFEQTHEPYLVELEPPEGASVEAAIAGAAYYALAVLLPARRTALNQRLDTAFDAIEADDDAKDAGYDFGVEVADRILDARGGDGYTVVQTDPGSTDLGKWRPVSAAAGDAALEPAWRFVDPFAIPSPSEFRPAAPPALDSAAYATALEEVRNLGASAATAVTTIVTRTATQTEIADFWRQATHIPFNAIARQVVNARDLTLEESARFFAQLAIALADSRIAAWDAKYEYDFWRPIHATRSDDLVAGTTQDVDWAPYLATPAHPEYPSGHSTTSAAAAAVLAAWFGEDVGFTVASDSLAGVTRAFASFTQSSEENGRSRIYGGIHYQFSNSAGQTLGRAVGGYVVDNLFAELPPPPPPVDAGTDEDEDAGVIADAGSDAGEVIPDAAVADAGRPDAGQPPVARPDAGGGPEPEPAEDAGPPYVADAGDGDGSSGGRRDDDGCSVAQHGSAGNLSTLALFVLAAMLVRRRRSHAA